MRPFPGRRHNSAILGPRKNDLPCGGNLGLHAKTFTGSRYIRKIRLNLNLVVGPYLCRTSRGRPLLEDTIDALTFVQTERRHVDQRGNVGSLIRCSRDYRAAVRMSNEHNRALLHRQEVPRSRNVVGE